jgi:hypothetical protein
MKSRELKREQAADRLDKPPTVDTVHRDMLRQERRGLPVRSLDEIIAARKAEATRLRSLT